MTLQRLQNPKPIYLTVFFIALVLRLIFSWQWLETAYGAVPFLDAEAYNDWAKEIANGTLYRPIAMYMSPMLPYILGGLYALFGAHLWLAAVLNSVLGSVACVLIARVTLRAFGANAGWAAGLLTALYRPFIFYAAPVMKETLVLVLLALFLNFAFEIWQNDKRKAYFWSGISLGLAAIVRGNLLGFVPFVVAFALWRKSADKKPKVTIFILGLLLPILPITIFNAAIGGGFVPLSYNDGFNAFIGHNDAATGVSYVFPPGVTSSPKLEEYDVTRVAVAALGHPLKPSEVSAYWRGRAMHYAFTHPLQELKLLARKIAAFWSNAEPYDNYDIDFIAEHFDTVLSWPLVCFGMIVAAAVGAGFRLRRKEKNAVMFFVGVTVIYMLTLFPFYVTQRYRMPAAICLLPLAGAIVPAFTKIHRREILRTAAIMLAALVLTLMPRPFLVAGDAAYDWSALSTIYEQQGLHLAAIQAFNQAMIINEHSVGSDAWIKVADARAALGHRADAEKMLQEGIARFPSDGSLPYNYGRYMIEDKNYGAAFAAFNKAIEVMPTFPYSYRGLAVVYDHFGDRAKAIEAVKHGLAIVPSDAGLQEVLAQLMNRH